MIVMYKEVDGEVKKANAEAGQTRAMKAGGWSLEEPEAKKTWGAGPGDKD